MQDRGRGPIHREGHVGMALALCAPLGLITMLISGLDLAVLGGVVAAGLAMLPNIDMRIPLVRHRGFTHTDIIAWIGENPFDATLV